MYLQWHENELLSEGNAFTFDIIPVLECLVSHFCPMALHGLLKTDWMAVPTMSSLIPMLCGEIKAFCQGYSSPADSVPQ